LNPFVSADALYVLRTAGRLSPESLAGFIIIHTLQEMVHDRTQTPLLESQPRDRLHVVHRPDGGMTLTFTNLSDATIQNWREFALEHLLGSDRLTRNLYDLRQVAPSPKKPYASRSRRTVTRPHATSAWLWWSQ